MLDARAAALARDARMWASRRLVRSLAPPDWLSVNLTLRCNLACVMCTTCYDAPELTTREVLDLVDQAAAWGVKVFNPLGGEPFVRTDLEDILAHAARRDLFVTLTTNGTLVSPARAARVAAIPPEKLHVNVSVDGLPDVHDAVRGKGSFKRTLAGYRHLRAADAAAGNPRRKVCANTILHGKNLDTFPALLDLLGEEGFDGVQVLNLFRNDADPTAGGLWFSDDQLPALDALVEALARHPLVLNAPADLRLVPRYYREGLRPLEAPCWAGWKELYVNADGGAIMCDGKLDFLAGRFGSVREKTLRELWASPELRARRDVVKRCTTPCIQGCYLRRDSDSLRGIATRAVAEASAPLRARAARLRPVQDVDATLTLELSDTLAHPDDPRCRALFARSPVPVEALWDDAGRLVELRDRGYLDFGRGFMGAEVVEHVLGELDRARLRFRHVALGWRGEPLLHPELERVVVALRRARGLRWVTSGLLDRGALPGEVVVDARLAGRFAERARPGVPAPARRGPVVSWDGRVTLDVADVRLERKVGDVLKEPFSAIWGRAVAG